jgi:hypothetical protein
MRFSEVDMISSEQMFLTSRTGDQNHSKAGGVVPFLMRPPLLLHSFFTAQKPAFLRHKNITGKQQESQKMVGGRIMFKASARP